MSAKWRRALGVAAASLALLCGCGGAFVATHGHPFHFISRQWHGFTHPGDSTSSGSHFSQVGSGRYDFWRVSLDAAVAHPLGGLGQDNFADYYVRGRRTREEPRWTHSLEMRLLAHTGFVGLGLLVAFLVAAIAAAIRALRVGDPLARGLAGASLLPVIVWLAHGSVDWFWEIPALSGPALGFLAMAGALGEAGRQRAPVGADGRAPAFRLALGGLAVLAAAFVLGFPYLSVREVSVASDISTRDPAAALRDLARAADLNPLSATPGRLAGSIALHVRQFATAEQRFQQAISREPGGWLAWLGDGLAASELGDRSRAHRDFQVAASINSRQPAVVQALARVYSQHPLTPDQAFGMLVFVR